MEIGRRVQVENLRAIWPKEGDLSDWLTTDDGLALIAEDVGVEIEDPERECRPGDYPCDIVGHAVGDEKHVVVIENQFGKTDHDHLGKLLTYAAMNQAMTGIWVAEQVSDDHRKVIDWLNDNTPPSVSLYLCRVKAYRIGNSPVAPQLDVVSRPNLEAKVRRNDTSDADKERYIWRKEFWEEILTYIKSQKPPFKVQSPSPDSWSNIAIGRSDFNLALSLTPRRKCIGCELVIQPSWKDEAFDQLEAQHDAVEAEIGASLEWQRLPGKKMGRIRLEAPIDPKNPANREKVIFWMHEQSALFHKAFRDRVKKLQAPALTDNDGSDG